MQRSEENVHRKYVMRGWSTNLINFGPPFLENFIRVLSLWQILTPFPIGSGEDTCIGHLCVYTTRPIYFKDSIGFSSNFILLNP